MSKPRPQIRWREADSRELTRLVKNFNAKIDRQRKKLIEQDQRYKASNLPQRAYVSKIKQSIGTRRDYNRELEKLQNFIDTGNPFKLDKNTQKSLNATVRDFNAKVERLSLKAKTQGERASLPAKLDTDEILKESKSLEALKEEIKDYKHFLKRGSEELVELPGTKHNIKLTKWQKDVMEGRLKKVNAEREKEKEEWRKAEVKYGGKKAGYTREKIGMDEGDFDFTELKLYNYSSTYSDLRSKFKLIMRESQPGYWNARAELARINYIGAMERIMGNLPQGKILLNHIKRMPLESFKRVLTSETDLFALLYEAERSMAGGFDSAFEQAMQTVWNEWLPDVDMWEKTTEYINRKADSIQ